MKSQALLWFLIVTAVGCDAATTAKATADGGGAPGSVPGKDAGLEDAGPVTANDGDAAGGDVVDGDAGDAGVSSTDPVKIVVLGASSACGKNLDQPAHGGEVGGLAFSWVNRYVAYLGTNRPGSSRTYACLATRPTRRCRRARSIRPRCPRSIRQRTSPRPSP